MVTASSWGQWPGTDPLEAARIFLGELGSPHLPVLPLLPQRGPGAEQLGRSLALLSEMPVDLQPYGWRLTQRPGADQRRSQAMLASDINALADAVGALNSAVPELKVRVTGPLSLAAGVYLPKGERAIADPGAVADVAASLAEGLRGYFHAIKTAVPGVRLIIQVDEPDAAAVLTGDIPTVSGYRRLPAVPITQARSLWSELLVSISTELDRTELGPIELGRTELDRTGLDRTELGRTELGNVEFDHDGKAETSDDVMLAGISLRDWNKVPFDPIQSSGVFGLATSTGYRALLLPESGLSMLQWEQVAAWVEAGNGIALSIDEVGLTKIPDTARRILQRWRDVGLPAQRLSVLRVLEAHSFSELSPKQGRYALNRLTELAGALSELAAQ